MTGCRGRRETTAEEVEGGWRDLSGQTMAEEPTVGGEGRERQRYEAEGFGCQG